MGMRGVVLVWVALGGATGCGDDGGGGSPGTVDYELFESTVELDAESLGALESVSADQAALRFSALTPQLEGLAPGDVVLAGGSEVTPRGLLRRVTAISSDAEGVLVETERTTVFHAFRRLRADVHVPLGGELTELPLPGPAVPAGARREALTATIPIGKDPIHLVLFDGDGLSSTTEDRVVADGKMMTTVTVRFWLSFDWGGLSVDDARDALDGLLDSITGLFTGEVSLGSLLDVRTGLEVTGDLDVLLAITGKSSLSFRKEERLAWFELPPIPVGPLVFVPTIALDGAVEGGIGGELSMDFGFHADMGLGFSYDSDDGLSPYVVGPTFDTVEPTATVTASARVAAELDLRISFLLYGFMGPYASIAGTAEMTLDRARTPCFRLEAGLEGRTGATIEVFGFELASFAGPSFPIGDPLELGTGACEPIPALPPTADPISTPWSRAYDGTTGGLGTDEGWIDLELAHDGRLLVSGVGGDTVMKVEEDGSLVWARSFTQAGRLGFLQPVHATPTRDAAILVSTHERVLVKLAQDGTVLWGAQIESDNLLRGFWTSRLVGDGVWLGGAYRDEVGGDQQAWLVGLEADGSIAFSWLWGDPAREEAIRMILPLDDGALIVGQSEHIPTSDRAFVMRLAQDGTVRWARHVDDCASAEDLYLADAIQTMDGNLVLGGWFYATGTHAVLLRMPPDGSGDSPAWATRTGGDIILGPQIRWIHQLPTGELRVVGRYAAVPDRVFVGGTDAVGRFAWFRRYGGTGGGTGAATGWITSRGGIFVATSSQFLSPLPGGYWLFEVSTPDGAGAFAPGSGVVEETISVTSADACLTTPAAGTATTPLPVALSLVEVAAAAEDPVMTTQ